MANALLSFLFQGNSQGLVSAAQQAGTALTQVSARVAGVNVSSLGAVAGVGLLAVGLKELVATAVGVSAEFQRLSTSFVSILAGPLLEANKQSGLTKENLETLRADSVRLFQDAQIAAIDTVATTKDYVATLQAALASGQQVGLTQKQIEEIT